MQRIYQQISRTLSALITCNQEWEVRHKDALIQIMETAPSGSGLDSGVQLLEGECNVNKLAFQADFHHLNQNGYYSGWSTHKVIVKPCLRFGIDVKVTGRDRNQIKDYIGDVVQRWLVCSVDREGVLWEEIVGGQWVAVYGNSPTLPELGFRKVETHNIPCGKLTKWVSKTDETAYTEEVNSVKKTFKVFTQNRTIGVSQ